MSSDPSSCICLSRRAGATSLPGYDHDSHSISLVTRLAVLENTAQGKSTAQELGVLSAGNLEMSAAHLPPHERPTAAVTAQSQDFWRLDRPNTELHDRPVRDCYQWKLATCADRLGAVCISSEV